MTIHDRVAEKVEAARAYAEDGAFRTAARILDGVAADLRAHAYKVDNALQAFLGEAR